MHALLAMVCLAAQSAPYSEVFEVRDPLRLVITPKMDGRFEDEEWDRLSMSGGVESAMQWEPGILYLGTRAARGKDVVWSLDMNGDGWLVGRDNLEIRIIWTDAGPVGSARLVDATDRDGPIWKREPLLDGMLAIAAATDGDSWVAEAKLIGLYLPQIGDGSRMGVRANAIPGGEATPEAFVPRNTTVTTLRWDRNRDLPFGVEWLSEYKARSVIPGSQFRVRLNFMNPAKNARFERIEMRCQGFLRAGTSESTKPFPGWGRRGRTFVDYETNVAADALLGYRAMQGRLTSDLGESWVFSSFLVAPTVMFDVNLPQDTVQSKDSQIVRGSVWIRSQVLRRIDGLFTLDCPSEYTISRGSNKRVIIYQNRGAIRVPLEIIIPQNASGAISLTFKVRIGTEIIQQTGLLAVRPAE
ncbi:MAG TPA: hypothetical protein PLL78_07585 [Fimbriimonadaceae bacterium]|nr:hypothetical protein [Fimbriimonadaceae bacterium]HRJ96535.1 hypothetical protein [Fimbriimonadaceae bacterium]